MTIAENTLKWWNDFKKINGVYPLIAEIESQLNMAVDNEKLEQTLSISVVIIPKVSLKLFNELPKETKDYRKTHDVEVWKNKQFLMHSSVQYNHSNGLNRHKTLKIETLDKSKVDLTEKSIITYLMWWQN